MKKKYHNLDFAFQFALPLTAIAILVSIIVVLAYQFSEDMTGVFRQLTIWSAVLVFIVEGCYNA